jgi:carbon-monoxide dehydrogenase medium subunit
MPECDPPFQPRAKHAVYDFEFLTATTAEDASAMLRSFDEAKLLAGGQTFLPVLKQRLSRPSHLVDLSQAQLAGIRLEHDSVVIGAMTTHATVASDRTVADKLPGVSRLASWIGDRQVRNRGTIGGSLANNDPTACYPAAVLALQATIETDRRSIAASEFFQGLFTTALEQDEVIREVRFPVPLKSAYVKFRHPASRYAMVGVFVAQTSEGARVAVTGAGDSGVYRHTKAEHALSADWSASALVGIRTSPDAMTEDYHGSAEYRAHLVDVMVRRAVADAV